MSKLPLSQSALTLMLLLLCLIFGVSQAAAQSTTDGAIGGVVKDPQGAVVANATATARNEETNKESTANTDSEGRFRIVQLQPGSYTVTVNAQGFSAFTQQKVVVEVGRVTSLDIPLTVGGAQETVEVTSEAPVINTSQQDFSTNINQTSINELPINGRRWSNFALLTPGAVPDGTFGLISFRGISGLLNNNTVDGGDNNNAFYSEERGRTRISYVVSQASIREFQVNTSNYSAEYGRAAGAVVNAVTKSGTNEFHGSAFYYLRDNKWGARNPLSFRTILVPLPSGGVTTERVALKPEDQRHQYGFGIGGPIVKDRLFFFFSFDQQKRNFPAVSEPSSPLFFTSFNQATLTSRGVSNAQRDAGLAFLQSLTGEAPRRGDQYIIFPKIDWRMTDKHTLTASYNRLRWDSPAGQETRPVFGRGIRSFGDDFVDVDTLNLRLSSTLAPTVFNEGRFQYGKELLQQFAQKPAPGEPTTGPGGFSPQVTISGAGTFGFGKPDFLDRRALPDERRLQFADTVTVSRGNHTFKFGGDINYNRDRVDRLFREGDAYSYSSLTNFLLDFANPANKAYDNFQQGFGEAAYEFSTKDYNFFFQDDWRVSRRLTVNLGVRYELQSMPDPQNPNPLFPRTAEKFPVDRNNWGPRFGFAYDLTGDGKTSIRGGYGIYYGRIVNSTISSAITDTGVTRGQIQIFLRPTDPGSPVYPNVVTAGSPSTSIPTLAVFSPSMANPQIHQADLIFEREIARNTVVSVSYLTSLGRRLPTFVDINLERPTMTRTYTIVGGERNGQTVSVPIFTRRLDPRARAITEIQSTVKSEYNALVLQANRRLKGGLQFQTSYTLSKARDTGQISATFTVANIPLNPYDRSFDRGRSNFDVRHRFVSSVVWSPRPFGGDNKVGGMIFNGFTISPIVQFSSGRPYSAGTFGTPSSAVTFGTFGTGSTFERFPLISRNAFRLPKTQVIDLRISRRFRFTETMNIEFLAEAFNLLNRTNVTSVNDTLYNIQTTSASNVVPGLPSGTSILRFDPAFGTPSGASSTLFRERQIQLAVRFHF